jgi:type II secretory pathway component GspD/PulD (secretin)/tetratricopeptide (TPR) repeat protein
VFSDRSGPQPESSLPAARNSSTRPQPRKRNLAALGLAAAIAAPLGVVQISQLVCGQDAKGDQLTDPKPDLDAELIRQGRDQFEHRQFEQAEKTLSAVKQASLSDKDRESYLSLLSDVKHAAIERRTAREEFIDGEEALRGEQSMEAISHFKAVATNAFADEEMANKARARLALLDSMSVNGRKAEEQAPEQTVALNIPAQQAAVAGVSQLSPEQRYELGVSEYRQGNWDEARKNLQLAEAAGYQPASLYQDPPSTIMKRMDARAQADRQRVQHLAQAAQATTEPSTQNDALSAVRATDESEQIRRQQAQTQAAEWVRQANDARGQQQYDKALDLYNRALEIDPNNAAAAQGRDQVMVLMGRNPSPTNLPNEASREIQARQGEIRYQIQSNLDQARAAIQAGDFKQAQLSIDRARLAASADPTIFTPEDMRRFRTQIDQADLDLQQAIEHSKQTAATETDKAIAERIARENREAAIQRQRTIADLIRTSQSLTNQGKYREALQTVDQILVLDSNNDYAVGVKPLLEDKVQFALDRQYTEMRLRKIGDQLNRAQEEMIPYDDILRYPTDWPEISQTRDQTVAAERSSSRGEQQALAQLDRQLPALQFDAVGFSDVIDFLRDVSGANIFVNWKSLEAAGIDRNTPVSASLRNVKFSKALNVILDSVGGGQTKLGYTIDEGVITISTADDLSKNVVVRVYDIRDLIVNIPDFTNAPQFSLDASQNQGGGGGGGSGQLGQGGSGGGLNVTNSLFAGGGQQLNQQRNQGPTRQDLVDAITKLIEDTVATDTWKDNGGSVGALRELEGQLIVTQTPENHRQLINLLEQLREERAIQVTIETRFLTVQRNFMEQIGVDLNFIFNLNSSWSKNWGTIPVTGPNSQFVLNPVTGLPGSIGSLPTTPTGLTTSATYLDDFQVQLMMQAVQASVTSSIVTAPRLTLFNGQRAFVLVTVQRAYISNLTPIVSTGISSFAPTVSYVQNGVLLDVQATVSADRKYVTLTLRPQLSTLVDLVPFTFQSSASVISNTGTGIGTTSVAPSGTIQEPEIQITEVNTSVSVPDGGTLLLGGQTLAGETEREVGVPILSKIPYLKRLFTSQSMAKDEQVLLILVRPTIIMQREIEQKQFPLLTSKLTSGG